MATTDADLIIAGAGCAGLGAAILASRLAPERRILVVDRDPAPGDGRTWAFWGDDTSPFAELTDRRWSQLEVRFPGWTATSTLRGRWYGRIRQRDFDAAAHDELRRAPGVELVTADVTGVRSDDGVGIVTTQAGTLRAPTVFQSALGPDATPTPRHPLRQRFVGWEVRTERPVFDERCATLMDFDGATSRNEQGPSFFYVLPDAADRGLVELTRIGIAPPPYDSFQDGLRSHLERLGAGCVEILRTETGTIPMEEVRRPRTTGANVFNIGTVGGDTKPGTGYTFQRTQRRAAALAASWAAGAVVDAPQPRARHRLADRLLLAVLHREPAQGIAVFEHLFRANAMDDVLDFLDEATTRRQEARLLSRLPWAPFLRAASTELAAAVRAGR